MYEEHALPRVHLLDSDSLIAPLKVGGSQFRLHLSINVASRVLQEAKRVAIDRGGVPHFAQEHREHRRPHEEAAHTTIRHQSVEMKNNVINEGRAGIEVMAMRLLSLV